MCASFKLVGCGFQRKVLYIGKLNVRIQNSCNSLHVVCQSIYRKRKTTFKRLV